MKYFLSIIVLYIVSYNSNAQTTYKVVDTFNISSNGWWDYLTVHGDRLYVSHGTQVNILNKNTGDSIGVINGTQGVHGIAFCDKLNAGYTSNGRLNNVYVFDINTHIVIDSIKTGKNPDAIMYEPFSGTIITCNGGSNDLTIIDPSSKKVIKTIPLPGKPETAISNGQGMLFVNIEDKNQVAAIDMKAMKFLSSFSLQGAEEPTGLAFDENTNRLFVGCDKILVVVDAITGKVIKKITIGEGCDGVAFDKDSKLIFTANGEDGTMSIIEEKSANEYKEIANIPTAISARTITIDHDSGTLYLPAAEIKKSNIEGQRSTIIPGTFKILVVRK